MADGDQGVSKDDPRFETLLEILKDSPGSTSYLTPRGWVVTFRVGADDTIHQLSEATEAARVAIRLALREAKMPGAAVVREETVHESSFGDELARRGHEELIDSAGVCARLGVSRQRLYQLRQTTWFPEPVSAAGTRPLWRERDIVDLAETWVRRSGRKKRGPRVIPTNSNVSSVR